MASLLGIIDRAAQRAGAFGRMRFIKPVSYAEATGVVRELYDQILAEYGLGGPFFVTSVSTPLLAATWGLVRTNLLSTRLPRGAAEAIAAAVAQAESCPFCVDVHAELASAAGERDTASLLKRNEWNVLAERGSDCDRLVLWARDLVQGTVAQPPVESELAVYATSLALTFVHVTSLVTIFQSEGLVAGFGGLRIVDGMAKAYMRTSLGKRMSERGPSVEPIPGLPRPASLSDRYEFAGSAPPLAEAWNVLDQAVDLAGAGLLSDKAQTTVTSTVAEHCRSAPSLDLSFLDRALASLPEAERGAARLAVLAGLAPYRVVQADLDAAGAGGDRGERWVVLSAMGVRARLHTLARAIASTSRQGNNA
jgi:AhpD family alkylhydroperoxidase